MNSIFEEIKKRNEEEIYIKPLNLAARTLVHSTEQREKGAIVYRWKKPTEDDSLQSRRHTPNGRETRTTFFEQTFFKPNKKFFDVQKHASIKEQIGKEVTAIHNGIIYKYEIRKMERKKTISLDPISEKCSNKPFDCDYDNIYNEIKHFYKILPWIQDDINDVYIRPLNQEAEKLILTKHSLTDSNGRQYFKPNKKYFDVQSQSKKKRQIKEEFSLVFDNIQYKMAVGIITNRGLVVQNEDIFRAETEFLNSWRTSDRTKETKLLLESAVNPSILYSAKQMLNAALKNNKPSFVENVIQVYNQHFGSKTESFISNLLDLVIFIDPQLSFLRQTIFSRRICSDGNFYKPSILPFLTPAEKLEEIYADPKIPSNTLDYVNQHFVEKKAQMRDLWIQNMIMSHNLGIKRDSKKTVPAPKSKPKILDIPTWKTVCKNASDIEKEVDENLLFYREDVDVYGFSIADMFKIIQTTGVNPYTKNPIPYEYIQRFLDTFHPIRQESNFHEKNEKTTTDASSAHNGLAELLDRQLLLLEKVCFVCRKGPTRKEYETYNGDDIHSFCSKDCYKKNREKDDFDVQPQDNNFSMLF
jgi:hypothetical protein